MARDPTEDIQVVIYGVSWMLRAEVEITAEAAVGEGVMVQTPTHPQQDREKTRGGGQYGRGGDRSA